MLLKGDIFPTKSNRPCNDPCGTPKDWIIFKRSIEIDFFDRPRYEYEYKHLNIPRLEDVARYLTMSQSLCRAANNEATYQNEVTFGFDIQCNYDVAVVTFLLKLLLSGPFEYGNLKELTEGSELKHGKIMKEMNNNGKGNEKNII